ncbi:MAG TPA: FAD-dependent oxidoreductase [Bryobacteraceae bacterium]|nr:FAD-dependent oxidoreductase [Bryobacteraceae bacterium]
MQQADVVVIGSGPAGLHAAIELAKLGVSAIVLEREPEAGGVPLWCRHHTYPCRVKKRIFTGPDYARAWVKEAVALRVPIRTSTTVVSLDQENAGLTYTSPEGPGHLQARAILLATGARESHRHQRLAAGDRADGIYTTASVFQSAYSSRGLRQRNFVVYGAEDVSYSCVHVLRTHGARVLAALEPTPFARSWRAAQFYFERVCRIPHFFRVHDTTIHGNASVNAITFTSEHEVRRIECDAVVFTGGFTPNSELIRPLSVDFNVASRGPSVNQHFETSVPWLFAAGNCLRGVVSGDEAALEGRRSAASIADFLRSGIRSHKARPIRLEGALAYCCPNRLSPACASVDSVSIWPAEHIRRGELVVSAQGRVIWRKPVAAAQPGRRLFVPIAQLLTHDADAYTICLRPDSN